MKEVKWNGCSYFRFVSLLFASLLLILLMTLFYVTWNVNVTHPR